MTRLEALNSNDSSKWKFAMKEEIKSFRDNGTWTLMNLLAHKWLIASGFLKPKRVTVSHKKSIRLT